MQPSDDGSVRWRPAAWIVVGALATLGLIWLSGVEVLERIREVQVVLTAGVLLACGGALALWAVSFSRLPARKRIAIVGALVLAVSAFLFLFRFRGVSGDLVPQFEPRFRSASSEPLSSGASDLEVTGDYPQFLGPDRNGNVTGVALDRDWASHPPRTLWRVPLGAAWSGFAVSGRTAVTQEQHDDEEQVVGYDLGTGSVLWRSPEPARYANPLAGVGPRATPTISNDRVCAMGATGVLKALDVVTGELSWKRTVTEDSGAELGQYGVASSPLVAGGLVIVGAGGKGAHSLVAYHADTGELAWSGGNGPPAYSSPFLAELGGTEQIVSLNHDSVTGHTPETGRVLWRQPWPGSQTNVVQPTLVSMDRLLVAAGWGMGAKLYQIRRDASGTFTTEEVWANIRLKPKFSNIVVHDDFVYGLDDGILVCLDPENGERRWKRGRYGHGQLLIAGDTLIVQTEHGEIVLVEPTPEEHRELARFRVLDEKVWNPPALAGRYLLVRNDAQAVLVELPEAS